MKTGKHYFTSILQSLHLDSYVKTH